MSRAQTLTRRFVEDHLGVHPDTDCNCLGNYRDQFAGEILTVTGSGDMRDRLVLGRYPDRALYRNRQFTGFQVLQLSIQINFGC